MADSNPFYEFAYIIDGVFSEEKTRDLVDRVTKYITENGGEVTEVDERGARRLAYPIRKRSTGYYVIVYMRAPADFIARLERAAEIEDGILRYLTLRYDSKMLRHYEADKQRRKDESAAAEKATAEEAA